MSDTTTITNKTTKKREMKSNARHLLLCFPSRLYQRRFNVEMKEFSNNNNQQQITKAKKTSTTIILIPVTAFVCCTDI